MPHRDGIGRRARRYENARIADRRGGRFPIRRAKGNVLFVRIFSILKHPTTGHLVYWS